MPRAVDPSNSEFIGSTQLPAGKFQGRRLAEVASTRDGLIYLHNLAYHANPPAFLKPQLRRAVRVFIEHPDRQLALKQFDKGR